MTKQIEPGWHLLADFFGASDLQDERHIEDALRRAAEACGATVLQIMLHHFGEGAGVTGVALLAESHMSIHTWPETGFAAIDVFLCGRHDPEKAIPVLKACFNPERAEIVVSKRGASLKA